MDGPRLVLVYNADSGRINALLDMAHKLFSPETYQCDLCAVTHGAFREREAWRAFVDALPLPVEYRHRDEFRRQHPEWADLSLPAVLLFRGDEARVLLSASDIAGLDGPEALMAAIRQALGDQPSQAG